MKVLLPQMMKCFPLTFCIDCSKLKYEITTLLLYDCCYTKAKSRMRLSVDLLC